MELRNRTRYLKQLISFQDTDLIKVVTGIRRCGKSSLLELMEEHLRENGVAAEQIVSMNFESMQYADMDSKALYQAVMERKLAGKRLYLFFDEVQKVPQWQNAVNSFRIDLDCDIYVTGSNAFLLSSELSTYLSGRYVEVKMLPLSFAEFLDFQGYTVESYQSPAGGQRKRAIDKQGQMMGLRELFQAYIRFGGMPAISETGLDQKKVNTLVTEGLLEEGNRKSKRAVQTISAYIDALLESYIFYEVKRFDIKGKDYLRTLGKYYIVDTGLRNYLLGDRGGDTGHLLENIIYLELFRRGYDVAIGKLDDKEIDFIATSNGPKRYIQVTETMSDSETRKRELAPLMAVQDNYEKVVITMDQPLDTDINGIKIVNALDFLLDGETQ